MELSIEHWIAILAGCVTPIIVALIYLKRPRRTKTTQDIIDKTNIINDVKHNKEDIQELKNDIDNLWQEITKHHAETDKIMGLISSVRERIARLEGAQ